MQQPNVNPFTVLRAICMQGKRVEVGDTVYLTRVEYSELANAGKVGPLDEKARKQAKKGVTAPVAPPSTPEQPPAPEGNGAADPQANEANP